MELVRWLLPTTEKLPKRMRFTLNNLALDTAEKLVEARSSTASSSASARTTIEERYSADRQAATRSFHSSTAQ